MTLLNQIVAVEKGVKASTERVLTDAYHNAQKNPILSGISRTYQAKTEDGDQLPPESTLVQVKVPEIIEDVSAALTRLFDVTATKDFANAKAKADVTVDGTVLVKDAPVPYLLFLEKQLVNLTTFISKLPALDPSEEWTYDSNTGAYKTAPSQTIRTKKVLRNHKVAEATPQHPEQVQVYQEDVAEGVWTTTKFSGALPADRITELKDRVEKLSTAVKFAREEANTHVITDVAVGAKVFDYLFA